MRKKLTDYNQEIEKVPDREKFRRIYEGYHRLMYHVAYQILHNREDAEDAVQETFIRVVKNISKISEPICPKTKNFLVIICRNVSLNILKKRNASNMTELSDYLPEQRPEADPQEASIEKDIVQRIVETVLELPDRYRDCMYMELVQEMDYEEIAFALGKKPETVRKQIQRGKKLLRQKLGERGIGYENCSE